MTTPRPTQPRLLAIVGVGVIFLAATALSWWVGSQPTPLPTPAAPAGGYPALLTRAADDLASRVAPTGPGLTFDVGSRQFLRHRESAPPILLEPSPGATPQTVDSYYIGGTMSRGFIHGTAFFNDIRSGLPETGPGDFAQASPTYAVIVDDDHVWRTNGAGYYETTRADIPGLGVDPFTLSRLPNLLRQLERLQDLGESTVDGQALHHFVGWGAAADWPGIIASDGLAFTASPILVEVWLTADGRLARLSGATANLNERVQNGVVVTEISFGTDVPAALPRPEPTLAPTPRPTPNATASTAP